MADALLEKASSALGEANESVTATTESAKTSLTDAQTSVAALAETIKTEAAAAPEKGSEVSTQAKAAVDNVLSKGIEGAKTLLHNIEEKSNDISSKLVGAVTNVVSGGPSSCTVASRDLPVSTDNQPLLTSREVTPWWKNCCGVLDILKKDTTN